MRKQQKFISWLLASFMIVAQFGWTAAAAADDQSPSPSPEASVGPSPDPSPSASVSPSPSASPSSSPEASASPSPSVSPAPSASPSPSPKPEHKYTTTGPDGCGGVIPDWVYDMATKKWVAADKGSFSCDKASGYYLSPKYTYDKRAGWYEILAPDTQVTAYMISAPNVVHTVIGDLQVGSKDYQVAQALGLLNPTNGIVLGGASASATTGSGSSSTLGVNNNGQNWVDLTNLVNVINVLQSTAATGNVAANSNTQVGDATTGAATVVANLINLLASAWSWSNGSLNFFMQSIGDLNHDLMLNPTQTTTGGGGILGSGAAGATDVNNTATTDVNAQSSANIVNNVDLSAQSGNASANSNTQAGNVTSGAALAQANIMNLINSFIASGNSFFGILNIFGNFNGDILFPQGFLNGVVGSGAAAGTGSAVTGPDSTATTNVNNNVDTAINNNSYNGVSNNISGNAASGSVASTSNAEAGNLATGSATNGSNVFNLSNKSIFGDNAVLVMVNIMGHWLGGFMQMPSTGASTQSALLTGNATVTNNGPVTGPDSSATTNVNNNATTNINQNTVGSITNNVNLNAQSGNATADKNSQVGDIKSGNAETSSNVANIFNTVINASHWFGVLIINVFGDWVGDVNDDTAAGGFSTAQAQAKAATQPAVAAPHASALPAVGLLALVTPSNTNGVVAGAATLVEAQSGSGNGAKVLTAAAKLPAQDVVAATKAKNMSLMFIISALIMLVAGALLTIDRKLSRK